MSAPAPCRRESPRDRANRLWFHYRDRPLRKGFTEAMRNELEEEFAGAVQDARDAIADFIENLSSDSGATTAAELAQMIRDGRAAR